MSFGEKGLNTFDPDYVPTSPLGKVSLFNNLWTINFPYWIQGTVQSRIRVWATCDLQPTSLTGPALEARHPVLCTLTTGAGGALPTTAAGLTLSREGIRVTQFAPNRDGKGTILRLWEDAGKTDTVTVTLPGTHAFATIMPVDLRGVPLDRPEAIFDDRFTVELTAYGPASFVLGTQNVHILVNSIPGRVAVRVVSSLRTRRSCSI